MTIELTKEELKLVKMCIEDKAARLLVNYFDSQIQAVGLQNRCKELYYQCDNLQKKLEVIYDFN